MKIYRNALVVITILVLLSILMICAAKAFAAAQVTATWVDHERIEVCSTEPGQLWRLVNPPYGYWIGDHPGGCVIIPPLDVTGPIDVNYWPSRGDVWCVAGGCAERLPEPPYVVRVVLYMPIIAQ